MPYATASDATRLYYEETGKGTPLVFVHELASDYRCCITCPRMTRLPW